MASERNALAELTERMASNEVRFVEGDEFPIHLSKNAIRDFRKARLIIAELAKVRVTHYDTACVADCINGYFNCRAIAEEGAKDGM